ncbi:MAG: hypothetical protein ABL956_01365 [Hyphomonadaceae bacterium]
MKFAPVPAYMLLLVLAMMGGLAMMFSVQFPPDMPAAVIGLSGVVFTAALGGRYLVMALERASMQAVRVRVTLRGEDR